MCDITQRCTVYKDKQGPPKKIGYEQEQSSIPISKETQNVVSLCKWTNGPHIILRSLLKQACSINQQSHNSHNY